MRLVSLLVIKLLLQELVHYRQLKQDSCSGVNYSYSNFSVLNKVKLWSLTWQHTEFDHCTKIVRSAFFLVHLNVPGVGSELCIWKEKTLRQRVRVLFYPNWENMSLIPLSLGTFALMVKIYNEPRPAIIEYTLASLIHVMLPSLVTCAHTQTQTYLS